MNFPVPALLGASLTLLTACGGGGGGGDPLTSPAPVGDGATDPIQPPAPGEIPETPLEGVWESSCITSDLPARASSRRYVVSVSDSLFSFNDTTYGDTLCSEDTAQREIDTRGSFTEPLPEDGFFIEDGRPIDLAVEDVILIPRQGQVATLYNDPALGPLCDVAAAWAVGVSQDISGCLDETGRIEVNTAAPRTDYNLFLVEDGAMVDVRADDRLRLGTVESRTTPDQRPTMVSQEVLFLRRPGSLARAL